MYCQIGVTVRQLLLLGVSFVSETAAAEDNTSITEHSTDKLFTFSNDSSSLKYLINASTQHPVNSSLHNWPKEDPQHFHDQSDNETLSTKYTTVSEPPGLDETLMNFTTISLNKSDADALHYIHRFKPRDLSKVLQISYFADDLSKYGFNRFSSYNLFKLLEAEEKKCTKDPERKGSCACDPDCRKYGDCCPDSIHFNPQEQKLGSSPFECTQTANGGVFTVSTCHSGWNDPLVRYKCENPDKSYGDPLRYIPVTSLRTNISYRNSHCAICNNDYLHNNIQLWPIAIRSTFNFDKLTWEEDPIRRLVYVSENSTWYLNLTGAYVKASFFGLEECPDDEEINIEYNGMIQSTHIISSKPHHTVKSAPLIKCWLLPEIPRNDISYLRPCGVTIHKCAENWQDISVKTLCEAYYAPVQLCQKVYRNRHCVMCNNWDSEVKSGCAFQKPQEFGVFWFFSKDLCAELHVFDPLLLQCRLLFNPAEYKPESIQNPDSERRMMLQTGEYVLSNDRSTVFVPAHNRLYNKYEFAVQDQQIILYLSQSSEGQYLPELDYVSAGSVCVSMVMLILHIVISMVMPETCTMEKNLRSFCFSLLLVYVSFIVSGSVTLGSTSCKVTAALLHYSLLVSFFWMLIMPLDTLRTIKRTIRIKNYLKAERRCCTFCLYSSLSWLTPIAIVGLTLAADFTHPESSFAPGYGRPICWFSHSSALIIFCLVPLVLVLILNTVLITWSAYLILDTEETLVLHSMLHTEFYFSARLVVLTNLCWIVGIFAACINTHGEWYIFVILHALQGVYVFFASSFTRIGKKMIIL